jgi:hypothetical protein
VILVGEVHGVEQRPLGAHSQATANSSVGRRHFGGKRGEKLLNPVPQRLPKYTSRA